MAGLRRSTPTVSVTAPADAACGIAGTVVEAELAACLHRVRCRSTYRWAGEIHDDDEDDALPAFDEWVAAVTEG